MKVPQWTSTTWGSLHSSPRNNRCNRYFNSTPTLYAPKKRRKKASSARKQAQLKLSKKQQSKKKQPKKKQPKKKQQLNSKDNQQDGPPQKQHYKISPIGLDKKTPEQREVPKAFLTSTASSYAFISRCAVMDEQTGEMYVDPLSLFSELNNQGGASNKQRKKSISLPNIFQNSHFEYFHPSSFPNHEPPKDGTPEVAFLGRSNTGKSSLINALASLIHHTGGGAKRSSNASGGGELARTSKRPGRTQTINYFGLLSNETASHVVTTTLVSTKKQQPDPSKSKLYLVDLPGFGYASAPDESVDDWQRKTQEFLISRASIPDDDAEGSGIQLGEFGKHNALPTPPLKRLYLLLDSRLSDPAELDLTVMGWCDEYCIPYTLVLTKVDASSKAQCVKLTNQLCMRYHSLSMDAEQDEEEEVYMDPVIYWTSSKDGLGMEELLLSVENNMFSADDDFFDGDEDDIISDDGDDEEDDDFSVDHARR